MRMRWNTMTAGVAAAALVVLLCGYSPAAIPGVTGPSFSLRAESGYILTGDPSALYFWGFADASGLNRAQYPGPTLIVNEGDTVTVTLTNALAVPVSIVFPGQTGVTAVGGAPGLLTQEAAAGGGSVTYSFVASNPGTYLYQSGTDQQLQVEMGLFGVLIVRSGTVGRAYDTADSAYDHEYMFLESEMDPIIHELMETGRASEVDNTTWFPRYWFFNGRVAPDTMAMAMASPFPAQPYNCMPILHPGDDILLRVVNAGRDFHPFHTHGNNFFEIARDARLLSTGPGDGANLEVSDFTITVTPGGTADCIFTWTGEKLGWDVYGHQADVDNAPLGNFPGPEDVDVNLNGVLDPPPPMEPNEYAPDHLKPFPVSLPDNRNLTIGDFWSGSPFLGTKAALPPGTGSLDMVGAYTFMWHSHKEKEMTTNNIFPGGMMTMLMVVPWSVEIED